MSSINQLLEISSVFVRNTLNNNSLTTSFFKDNTIVEDKFKKLIREIQENAIPKVDNTIDSISTENGTYTFKSDTKLNLDTSLSSQLNLNQDQKAYLNTVVQSYNNAYEKGYLKNPVRLSLNFNSDDVFLYYDVDELKEKYEKYKAAELVFQKNREIVNAAMEKSDALIQKHRDENANEENEDAFWEHPDLIAMEDEFDLVKDLPQHHTEETRLPVSIDFLEKNLHQLDKNINKTGIFTYYQSTDHKNMMWVSSFVKKNDSPLESSKNISNNNITMCSANTSIDKSGHIVNFAVDKDTMAYGSKAEREIYQKHVLLHELSHCQFGSPTTKQFKNIETGNPSVDKKLNYLFVGEYQNKLTHPYIVTIDENFADTYAAIIAVREDPPKEKEILKVISDIKSYRAIDSQADSVHMTAYGLDELSKPEILTKIKNLPVEELQKFTFNIAQKATAKYFAESEHLSNTLKKESYKSAVAAISDNYMDILENRGKSPEGESLHSDLKNILKDEFSKLHLSSSELKEAIYNLNKPQDDATKLANKLDKAFNSKTHNTNEGISNEEKIIEAISKGYLKIEDKIQLEFSKLPEIRKELQDTLNLDQKKGFSINSSISLTSIPNEYSGKINSSPEMIMDTSISSDNAQTNTLKFDKESIGNRISVISAAAVDNRNKYLNENLETIKKTSLKIN